jgi:hypothetical protein
MALYAGVSAPDVLCIFRLKENLSWMQFNTRRRRELGLPFFSIYERGPQILQKHRSYLKILGSRWLKKDP